LQVFSKGPVARACWCTLGVNLGSAPVPTSIMEVYVDAIIFESDDDRMSHNFSIDMQNEFEIYLLGELTLFLGLQICQLDKDIFISETNYIGKMLKKFGMED
jgi:hypothetical protein